VKPSTKYVGVLRSENLSIFVALCMRAEMLRVVAQEGRPRGNWKILLLVISLAVVGTHAPLRLELRC
jgi:hypothetical protein